MTPRNLVILYAERERLEESLRRMNRTLTVRRSRGKALKGLLAIVESEITRELERAAE